MNVSSGLGCGGGGGGCLLLTLHLARLGLQCKITLMFTADRWALFSFVEHCFRSLCSLGTLLERHTPCTCVRGQSSSEEAGYVTCGHWDCLFCEYRLLYLQCVTCDKNFCHTPPQVSEFINISKRKKGYISIR